MKAGSSAKSIKLESVRKSYGSQTVLDDLNLHVEPGEFVSMLGPSGSGKTTVLNLIAGFDDPDAGSVLLDGRNMTGIAPEHRNIGVVFQNYSLFPHMSVAENIEFPLRMRGVSKAERREAVGSALFLVALDGFGDRKPEQLSGGQQQRVAIARAVVFNPDVLLMDEPLGALDRRLRGDLQLEIKTLHEELGITIIYVTHDQEEALSMSDRVVVFNKGRVEQEGKPREVYRRPATLFVADFLGDSLSISATASGDSVTLRELNTEVAISGHDQRGPVRLLWRSDHVSLAGAADPGDRILSMPATVETVAYAGTITRMRVKTATGDIGVIEAPEDSEFAAGDAIVLALDLDKASLLPADNDNT
ncbi:ABC transporter ATP-binding protein [Hoeflea sp. CAU 1731]